MTFAYKLVKKVERETPVDAAPTNEEAAVFESLESANQEMNHFMIESKFQNLRQEAYLQSMIPDLIILALQAST